MRTALVLLLANTLPAQVPTPIADDFGKSFQLAAPEDVGMSSDDLCALTAWIRDEHLPLFSLLISRRGKLVYELYTGKLERDHAHYVMSVTKSVVALLIGIAIDDKVLPAVDTPLPKILPASLFGDAANRDRCRGLSLLDVLDMRAIDATLPPRDLGDAAATRQRQFVSVPNRVAWALTLPLLPDGGFQYSDITPQLAVGALQYAAHTTALEFANERLFGPLGARNVEWMHQDADGIDNGAYGLRLRPIDMQKLGVLFLELGRWNDRQLVPKSWIERLQKPTVRSRGDVAQPNYGCYWWTKRPAPGWTIHEANGWKGQRIAVVPEQDLVVTTTACFADESEHEVLDRLLTEKVRAAVRNRDAARLPKASKAQERLRDLLRELHEQPFAAANVEPRMVPAFAPKESHRPFAAK